MQTELSAHAAVGPVAPTPMTAAMPQQYPLVSGKPEVSPFAAWAFDHKKGFSKENPLAWYGLRNVVSNIIGITGLMATIVPVRMAMGHGAQWAEKRGYDFLSKELSRTMWQNSLGVGVSFATFRTLYKLSQRSYDDLFVRPQSKEEADKALHDLPHKAWENVKQIAKVEYPVTMAAAFALVGIRAGIAGEMPAATLAKKGFGEVLRDKDIWRDTMGCAFLAYPAFFEITDRFGRAGQLENGYDDKYHNEHIGREKDGVKNYFMRQLPGIASGIIPYILSNTWALNNVGRQKSYNTAQRAAGIKQIDSFGKAFWQERPYQFFWMFTLGRDLYYDWFDKKFAGKKEPGEHSAALPTHGQPVAQTDAGVLTIPGVQVQHAIADGRAAVPHVAHAVAS